MPTGPSPYAPRAGDSAAAANDVAPLSANAKGATAPPAELRPSENGPLVVAEAENEGESQLLVEAAAAGGVRGGEPGGGGGATAAVVGIGAAAGRERACGGAGGAIERERVRGRRGGRVFSFSGGVAEPSSSADGEVGSIRVVGVVGSGRAAAGAEASSSKKVQAASEPRVSA